MRRNSESGYNAAPTFGDNDAKKTYLTNYLYLTRLINDFNDALAESEKNFEVDKDLILIRDGS
jgi:hypothetical protein